MSHFQIQERDFFSALQIYNILLVTLEHVTFFTIQQISLHRLHPDVATEILTPNNISHPHKPPSTPVPPSYPIY